MTQFVDWSVKAKGIVGAPFSKENRLTCDSQVTHEMIEDGYRQAAKLVQEVDEKYLPIFERLCYEQEQREKTQALLEKAWSVELE